MKAFERDLRSAKREAAAMGSAAASVVAEALRNETMKAFERDLRSAKREAAAMGSAAASVVAEALQPSVEQIQRALCLGVPLKRGDTSATIWARYAIAEQRAQGEQVTPMQLQLVECLGLSADEATRDQIAFELLQEYGRNRGEFFRAITRDFERRWCESSLERLNSGIAWLRITRRQIVRSLMVYAVGFAAVWLAVRLFW